MDCLPSILPQCRERWVNHLDPAINKSSWTEREDRIVYVRTNTYVPPICSQSRTAVGVYRSAGVPP